MKYCKKSSGKTSPEPEYIWHSPLLQGIATLRASGQHFCATACQELFTLLHTFDPTERYEPNIVRGMIERLNSLDAGDRPGAGAPQHSDPADDNSVADWRFGRRYTDPRPHPAPDRDTDPGGDGGGI